MSGAIPVGLIATDEREAAPTRGIGLCLSGGGYRAMLFHLGPLRRLIEVGLLGTQPYSPALGRLERVSSVSGGSITAAILGLNWPRIGFGTASAIADFLLHVERPIRALASTTIDVPSILLGMLPGASANAKVIGYYRKFLFGAHTIAELSEDPRFVINATNLQSGALWRFSSPYMADWKVGLIPRGRRTVGIAEAVAASSAFPPLLSPARFRFDESDYEPGSGGNPPDALQRRPYTTDPVLVDGGVYDNLGLETVWKNYRTVLVSDGGGHMTNAPDVKSNWYSQGVRVIDAIDNQVRSLRKRNLIASYGTQREGAYWGIRSDLGNFVAPGKLHCPLANSTRLAQIPTRLKKLDELTQMRLINWGYAVCDAALRAHVDPALPAPAAFPYPDAGV